MIGFDKVDSLLNKLQCDLIKAESRCMDEYYSKRAFERYCDTIAYYLFDTAKEIIEAKYQDFNKGEEENG